jgi:hypothetical protein
MPLLTRNGLQIGWCPVHLVGFQMEGLCAYVCLSETPPMKPEATTAVAKNKEQRYPRGRRSSRSSLLRSADEGYEWQRRAFTPSI